MIVNLKNIISGEINRIISRKLCEFFRKSLGTDPQAERYKSTKRKNTLWLEKTRFLQRRGKEMGRYLEGEAER